MVIARYMRWLHTGWPAGTVEKLPDVRADGTTAVPGVRVAGDLTGIPLLKFSADTGARAVHAILQEESFARRKGASGEVLDLAIIGAGVAGVSAAIEAEKSGLNYRLYEATQLFSTVANFPRAKPIFTYPTDMKPCGDLQFTAQVKEQLLEELDAQRRSAGVQVVRQRITHIERKSGELYVHYDGGYDRALRVIVAIGRSGNFRKLGVPGEHLDKVFNRLHDPRDFAGKKVVVVGGGDSALETAIATAKAGAHVTISYRKKQFSRAKPENIAGLSRLLANVDADVAVEHPSSERVTTAFSPAMCANTQAGSICTALGTQVVEIREHEVDVKDEDGRITTLPNDVVFAMIGREPPLGFFRRSRIPIRGEWRARSYVSFALFLVFCILLYHFKSDAAELPLQSWWRNRGWFPFNIDRIFAALGNTLSTAAHARSHLLYTLRVSMSHPSFYYTLAYSMCILVFGIRRIRRRRTPYVTRQTITLMLVQWVPLFLLPEILLPWAGRNGWFDGGLGGAIAAQLFPHQSYWRAYGLILAWPLFLWNIFTDQPLWGWLIIGSVQTFVVIPLLVRRWGKGAYCGWICSCGALAETMGDTHRHKMPHGPRYNRLNMVGQAVLALAVLLLILRVASWSWPGTVFETVYTGALKKWPFANYKWTVDIMLAGVLGLGCYFWFSGRVWCRFACPLAALMHIYARFSRFRIFADKKKCISCNVCTSVCHQGIDVMNFANKGLAMRDPECVRCSACVHGCPTGVLSFGRLDARGEPALDRLAASPVQIAERARTVSLPVRP